MRKTFLFVVLIAILSACSDNHTIIIKGKYPAGAKKEIYINRVNLDNPVPLDTVGINKSGSFKMKFKAEEASYYNLGIDQSEFITLAIEPGDRIFLEFEGKKLQNNYYVKGSEESDKIRLLDKKLGNTLLSLDSIKTAYDQAIEENDQEKSLSLQDMYREKIDEQRNHNISFILENLGNLSAVKALYQRIDENTFVLYRERDLQYLKLVSDSLGKYYPDIMLTRNLARNLESELNTMYANRITEVARDAESISLDANLEDLSGNRIRLTDVIKENIVLLSFWSAKSNECVSNNLFMKEMYKLYHRDGFEIYQVNLDSDETLWKNSVQFDEIPWISVREDDPGNPLTARIFNVSQVPANYLFDKDGNIIGKDLFGRSLKIKLGQLFD